MDRAEALHADVAAFLARLVDGRCSGYGILRWEIEWVTTGQHYTFEVQPSMDRAKVQGNKMTVGTNTSARILAHEFGHCIGLPAEYRYEGEPAGTKVSYRNTGLVLEPGITVQPIVAASAGDASIMSTSELVIIQNWHCYNIGIEVQEFLTAALHRTVRCTVQ